MEYDDFMKWSFGPSSEKEPDIPNVILSPFLAMSFPESSK
jgi:hypothetical protein